MLGLIIIDGQDNLIKISIAYMIVIGGVTFYHAANRYMLDDMAMKRLSLNNNNDAHEEFRSLFFLNSQQHRFFFREWPRQVESLPSDPLHVKDAHVRLSI